MKSAEIIGPKMHDCYHLVTEGPKMGLKNSKNYEISYIKLQKLHSEYFRFRTGYNIHKRLFFTHI